MALNIYDYIKLVAYCNLENMKYIFSSETAGLLGLLAISGASVLNINFVMNMQFSEVGVQYQVQR